MAELNWKRLPPLSSLRAFEATARFRGFSAAARSLNVTPAAIAQQVRKLERELGTGLVRRDGRGIVLTTAGRHLSGTLREAFGLIAEGVDEVRRQEALRGVRVSTTQFFVDAVILRNLGDFWTRHPGVQVTFAPEGNGQPVNLDNFDVCVRAGQTADTWSEYACVPLVRSPFVVCASPDLLKASGHDLSTLPWLFDPNIEDMFAAYFRQLGLDPEAVEIIDTGSPHLELEAAVAGFGLSLSTELIIRPHLDDGRLVLLDVPSAATTTYFAVHRKGHLSAHVARFLDWLKELCRAF